MKIVIQNKAIVVVLNSEINARFAALVTVFFAYLLFFSSSANARLDGDVSLTYSLYNGSAKRDFIPCPVNISMPDGSVVSAPVGAVCVRNADGSIKIANGSERSRMSSSSLVQNYSVLYSSTGEIYNSRVGHYDVALGYNWTALDTTFKSSSQPDDDYNKTRGHLMFKGEVNIDPKEVPFRLNAYSRDMSNNTISMTNGNGMQNFGSILGYRDQATGINDGLHIESGVTLVAGVKNGMTNGYNELLRHFPMILIDYKDSINRDMRSTTPSDDRLSRLAFVSLNKKDNWFHYRHTLYEDHLNNLNNYVENEVQLGTVDQYMARRWIDFSNWIKVSTDLQFSKRQSNYQANAIEDINLNLFVIGERKSWNVRTFSTFDRYKDENNKLSYQATIPVYASGVYSKDVSWNARTSYRDNQDIDNTLGTRSKFTNMLAGYRVDAYKVAPFTFSQSFDVESSKTNISDFMTLSGTLETASTARFSRNLALGAVYNIKNSTTTSSSAPTSDFLEQKLDLRGGYSVTDTLRFEAHQTTTFTKGNFVAFSGTTRDSQTQLGQYYNPRSQLTNNIGSETYSSLTTLSAAWNPKPRLSLVNTISEDIYKTAVIGVSPVTEVLSVIAFTNDIWSVSNSAKYTHGSRDILDDHANSISNNATLRYIHSRNLDASASAFYLSSYSNGSSTRESSFEQRANYKFYTKSGVARKIFEVNETLLYNDGAESKDRTFTKSLMLGFSYYPIRQLTLSGGAGYSYTTSISDYSIVGNASVIANFRLLQTSLDYVHGIRKSDGAREDKFTGNVRKSF